MKGKNPPPTRPFVKVVYRGLVFYAGKKKPPV
ncbi:hypothetical protein, partial [Escherichia coli]